MFVSCKHKDKQALSSHSLSNTNYQQLGDSISMVTQQALMKELMAALETDGPVHAINFCSERAIPLTDSVASLYHCSIKRVAYKNRNSTNALTPADLQVFNNYAEELYKANPVGSKIVEYPNEILYYKPIIITMPQCLQCHGDEATLNPEVKSILAQKYPADKALNFKEGDLRGLWRIAFTKQ
jgi:hypothetical protein